ncbi:MAG: hypothetical protein FJ279_35350 [Planctomycetes bacterium]|nr:hypothetical protein [Planctomycetota bacterium]
MLAELVRDVVRPLGPTLLQVPDRKTDVAILESFSSQMFAGRGTYGWSGSWEADMHLILQWAHLQPKTLFDETVARDGLEGYRVLVMPFCDVLTESVWRKVKEFQKRGGLVVSDEFLTPAIIPDIVIPSYKRTGKAEEDKAALQAKAADLRKELDPFYQRYGEASNPDVVVRFRQYRGTDYLFAINDKRTFGDYVGHHGKVMEKGLPNAATVSVSRKTRFVYDLVAHKGVWTDRTDKGLEFPVNLGPGDGRLFMITAEPIIAIRVTAPAQARLGARVPLSLAVVDSRQEPVEAVVPLHVEILDPQNRLAEGSGHYAAKDGKLDVPVDLAPNDLAGEWTIRAKELASGLTREHRLTVIP